MTGPWENYQGQAAQVAPTAQPSDGPWNKYAQNSQQEEQKPSFLGEMKANFQNGIQSGKDLLSGDYEDIGNTRLTPKTQALGDKLFPQGSDGTAMDALRNVGNTNPSDWSSALLEKFGDTPEGKAVGVIGGIHPVFNAANTAVNRYANPAISDATGIAQPNLQLMELAAAPLGLKKAGEISDPALSAVKSAASAISEKVSKPEIPTAEGIRGLASQAYQAADQQGGMLNPSAVNTAITKAGAVAPQTLEGRAFAGASPSTQALSDLSQFRDKPLSLKSVQEIDEDLSERMEGQVDPKTGILNKQGYKLLQIQQALRDASDNAGENDLVNGAGFKSWKQGQQLYSASMRMGDIDRIMARAEQTDNPVTAIKTGFRTLANNPSRLRGYTTEEIAAINDAAKTGIITNGLRLAGSRLGPIAAGAAGLASGGPLGALAATTADYALSGAARAGANAIQRGKGNAVRETIANRPAVQSALNPNPTPIEPTPSGAIPAAIISGAQGEAQKRFGGAISPPKLQTPLQGAPAPQSSLPDVQNFAKAESSNNPNAKNPNSSASGLFQFTNRTWADMVNKYGKQAGIDLADKSNPQAQATMASLLAKDNIQSLQHTLGRLPSKGELYMAHVLGANGAAKLINADPSKEAIMLFPRQVFDANRPIFFNGRQPRTVADVYKLLNDKVT